MRIHNKDESKPGHKILSPNGTVERQGSSPSINILQVAKSELISGDTSGRCYVQQSAGAAFFLTDRRDAIKNIEKAICEHDVDQNVRT
mmetsp:Transcript_9328/g.10876  ORF Transcript_9328/g.10876 Transcript_9328/m.10876 type:complete len:88 (+) Transcript_9328:116-379(+)